MRNIIWDMNRGSFHMDQLLAAITALFWFRCIMLFRLNSYFGPLLEIIFTMFRLIGEFLVIFVIELIVFSCIAALTLTKHPKFANLFEAMRTFINASLGDFDLRDYDEYEGFEKWLGLNLHILALFVNMILVINLLIAIMSDMYSRMADLKVGLYWSTVIKEMPKYKYHDFYGALVMFPFIFSWMGFLFLPLLVFIKKRRVLRKVNNTCFMIVFSFQAAVVLVVFMGVNLLLLPVAFLKTTVHKFIIYKNYRGRDQLANLFFYVLLGVPLLLASQATDVYYFLQHMYKAE